jgi:hypothetical protein
LKSYFYYLLLLVGVGVARDGVPHAGAASPIGGRARSDMVACLLATAETVLMNLAAAALGVRIEVEGGEGY